MTRKVKGLNVFQGDELVEINPDDAKALKSRAVRRSESFTKGRGGHEGEVTSKSRRKALSSMTFQFAESPANIP